MIFVYNEDRNRVVADAFEVSAEGESVIASDGLLRRFPGVSVALPAEKFSEPNFCAYLASSISQLASEEVERVLSKSRKAHTEVTEHRGVAHPGLITEGLMVQLLALGSPNEEDCTFVKSIHDEVNWQDALLPWRRSPGWLVLRVALQTVLQKCFPTKEGRNQYKNFILYLLSKIGSKAFRYTYSEDLAESLEIIRAKLGRRIYKLRDSVFPFVADHVHSTTKDILSQLKKMQHEIRLSEQFLKISSLPSASAKDFHISLLNSRKYIENAMRDSSTEVIIRNFDPPHEPDICWDSDGLPILNKGSIMELAKFEDWVGNKLQNWSSNVKVPELEDACYKLQKVLEQYWKVTAPRYESNAQAMSILVLVLLELWMEIDKMAVEICPWLEDFSPEIPLDFVHPLLLPLRSQMKRASAVEDYICERYRAKSKTSPSIFTDPCEGSFPVRYFDKSETLRALERQIEAHGETLRRKKKLEWEEFTTRYHSLCDESNKEVHLQGRTRGGNLGHLEKKCKKCSLKAQAKAMAITIYERLLPNDIIARKTAVFELKASLWFMSWRDATWLILHDATKRGTQKAGGLVVKWVDSSGIKDFAPMYCPRVTLGSDIKSFEASHYRTKKFPVAFENVCVPNALNMRMLDGANSAWVTGQCGSATVKSQCTINMPQGLYSGLQHTFDSTRTPQNQIMAIQKDCPPRLSLHEFIAYGCLRSGERVQWYNILRELASSALSVNEQAVVQLIKQSAWEFGSPSERC